MEPQAVCRGCLQSLFTQFVHKTSRLGGKFLRELDIYLHKEVAARTSAVGNAFSADPYDFAVSDPCGHANHFAAIQCMDTVLSAQKRIGKLYRERRLQIVPDTREIALAFHMDLDVEVSRSTAVHRLSHLGHADHLAVRYSPRYDDMD